MVTARIEIEIGIKRIKLFPSIVTGNIDYLARVTLLHKIGNVHPVIAVPGLIVGLKLFGFRGFIFGSLMISYFPLLARIYAIEFGSLNKYWGKRILRCIYCHLPFASPAPQQDCNHSYKSDQI